jgi:hypothetical protein
MNFMALEEDEHDILSLLMKLELIIEKNSNLKLSDNNLCELLGMGKRYIYRINQELDYKEFYTVTDKTLERWKLNILRKLPKIAGELISCIDQFKAYQDSYPFSQRSTNHKNLKYNYFDEIDSKEKAYWLGVLFADGNVGKDDRITFHQNLENSELVYNFADAIGFNKNKIKDGDKVLLRIGNKRLAVGLKKYGCIPAKSKIILLPKLNSRRLYLAFLLGYYDGDGTVKTSKITSGSKRFLEQIKEMFKIKNKINIRKGAYDLYLGADLFNEMLCNYSNSLNRKRIKLESSAERRTRFLREREKYIRNNLKKQ